jgi:hypothetical protein
MKFDIHVCLVSKQPTPNLTPVMDPAFRPKSVILMVSNEMRKTAEALKAVYKKYQVGVTQEVVSDPYDFEPMIKQYATILSRHQDDSICLNVTGGTKVMAMAAQTAFQIFDKPIFYVNVETNEIQFMKTPYLKIPSIGKLTIDDYLVAHGYDVIGELKRSMPVSQAHRDLTRTLVLNIGSFSKSIGRINALAQLAEINKSLMVPLDETDNKNENLIRLLSSFSQAGVLNVAPKNITFIDENARFYANGGWLEEFVFNTVKEITTQDSAVDVEVQKHDGEHSKNQIDVMVLAKNRLHLIECKTSNLLREGEHGTEALYKLDSLTALGGLNTRNMLVSYRPLKDTDLQRAKDLKIKVISEGELSNLKNLIESWLKGK